MLTTNARLQRLAVLPRERNATAHVAPTTAVCGMRNKKAADDGSKWIKRYKKRLSWPSVQFSSQRIFFLRPEKGTKNGWVVPLSQRIFFPSTFSLFDTSWLPLLKTVFPRWFPLLLFSRSIGKLCSLGSSTTITPFFLFPDYWGHKKNCRGLKVLSGFNMYL